MYCFRSKQDLRILEWGAMGEGVATQRAPLLFANKELAEEFAGRMMKGERRHYKLEQTQGMVPCWYYEGVEDDKPQYCWHGPVELANIDSKRRIRHPDGLGPELEKECREVWELVGKLARPSYEQWEFGFLCDEHPEKELAVWRSIGEALNAFMADHLEADPQQIMRLLLTVAGGSKEAGTEEVLPYYRGLITPLVLGEPKPEEMQFTASKPLAAVIPADELRKLVQEWTEKAMHKQCDTESVTVWTKYGEVMIAWDWEKKEVLAGFKSDVK